VDEPAPATLRARVLARAAAAPRQAPKPSSAPDALPLFALVPVMAALVAVIRSCPEGWRPGPRRPAPKGLALLDLIGPTPSPRCSCSPWEGLATLALAPALFLESRGPRHTLGAQS
jgi:hypothetical protein